MQLKRSAHSVYQAQYHIVWVTRYRRNILVRGLSQYLKTKLLEVERYYPDWELKTNGIARDHLHIYMVIPPKYSVSQVVETLKKNTSRHLRKKFRFLDKVYWDTGGIWSRGYFVSTVGINEEVIRKYVEMRGKEDTGQAKLEL